MTDFSNINLPVMTLTDRQLLDYIRCPNYFYAKYISKLPVSEETAFQECVEEVINGYFARLLEGHLPSIEKAKKMWDRLCEENPQVLSDKKVLEGFGLIKAFDRYCYDNKLIIADFNTPYTLEINALTKVTGTLGAIRVNNEKLELFFVSASKQAPDQHLLNMSLKYTLQCYALKHYAKNMTISGIRILHLRSGQEFTTYRSETDFSRLDKTINNVSKCIREEIYYPREDYTCPRCQVKNFCGYI